ncbi:MAG TPA: CPBP family glutamic-type intramembrane protease [bacterium]|nr:CPBP family glutamic-type intramembrane protease [bacterium]
MATPALIAPLLIVVGCAALLLRPVGVPSSMFITVGVGVIGLLVPVRLATAPRVSTARWVAVVAIGIAAFVIARTRTVAVPSSFSPLDIGANAVAAVAEEIFFRRLTFGWLTRWGSGIAVMGSAAAFALVHARAYGLAALPLDLAAGILFGWQRWSSGGWAAPALTHVVANLLQMR